MLRELACSQMAGKIKKLFNFLTRGAIAQLGERIVRNDEVVGSIPTSSTKSLNQLPTFEVTFHYLKPSLIGPFWSVNWTVLLRFPRTLKNPG